jgi:hypothetical protein
VGDYYEEEHWRSEWSYVLMMPLLTTIFTMGFLIVGYYSTVHLMGIEAQVAMACFSGMILAVLTLGVVSV